MSSIQDLYTVCRLVPDSSRSTVQTSTVTSPLPGRFARRLVPVCLTVQKYNLIYLPLRSWSWRTSSAPAPCSWASSIRPCSIASRHRNHFLPCSLLSNIAVACFMASARARQNITSITPHVVRNTTRANTSVMFIASLPAHSPSVASHRRSASPLAPCRRACPPCPSCSW